MTEDDNVPIEAQKIVKRAGTIEWWAYFTSLFAGLGFIVPSLISARDTLLVLIGLILIVVYGVWSYHLWLKPLIKRGMESE